MKIKTLPARLLTAAVILIMVLAAGSDCNRKVDTGRFVAVYTALARATATYAADPDRKSTVHDSILAAHGFTRESFGEYADLYRDEPEKWQALWKKIERNLDAPGPAFKKQVSKPVPAPAGTDKRKNEAGARPLPPPQHRATR